MFERNTTESQPCTVGENRDTTKPETCTQKNSGSLECFVPLSDSRSVQVQEGTSDMSESEFFQSPVSDHMNKFWPSSSACPNGFDTDSRMNVATTTHVPEPEQPDVLQNILPSPANSTTNCHSQLPNPHPQVRNGKTNIDTLTAEAVLDLGHGQVTSTEPETEDRNAVAPGEDPKPAKRARRRRTVLEAEQQDMLEEAFTINMYPTRQTKLQLAQLIGIDEERVKIWFQNKRSRLRRKAKQKREAEKINGTVTAFTNGFVQAVNAPQNIVLTHSSVSQGTLDRMAKTMVTTPPRAHSTPKGYKFKQEEPLAHQLPPIQSQSANIANHTRLKPMLQQGVNCISPVFFNANNWCSWNDNQAVGRGCLVENQALNANQNGCGQQPEGFRSYSQHQVPQSSTTFQGYSNDGCKKPIQSVKPVEMNVKYNCQVDSMYHNMNTQLGQCMYAWSSAEPYRQVLPCAPLHHNVFSFGCQHSTNQNHSSVPLEPSINPLCGNMGASVQNNNVALGTGQATKVHEPCLATVKRALFNDAYNACKPSLSAAPQGKHEGCVLTRASTAVTRSHGRLFSSPQPGTHHACSASMQPRSCTLEEKELRQL